MKKIIRLTLYIILCSALSKEAFAQKDIQITDTAKINLKIFAEGIVKEKQSNVDKAKTVLDWLSNSFDWKSTDYQNRTIKEIIVRKGGNCFELARVYMALIKELNINYRPIAEINIHKKSEDREKRAAEKVKQNGNQMSVFGEMHNDHRWVEVYDEQNLEWIPVDPTMGLFGFEQWLKGRAWFGKRETLNQEFNNDMIVPIAIFVTDKQNPRKLIEDRTAYYMVTKLNNLYKEQLNKLNNWNKWVQELNEINPHIKAAYEGTENLHNYVSDIAQLAQTYSNMKAEIKK